MQEEIWIGILIARSFFPEWMLAASSGCATALATSFSVQAVVGERTDRYQGITKPAQILLFALLSTVANAPRNEMHLYIYVY